MNPYLYYYVFISSGLSPLFPSLQGHQHIPHPTSPYTFASGNMETHIYRARSRIVFSILMFQINLIYMSSRNGSLEEINKKGWIDQNDFNRQCDYLFGAYFRLEKDFLEYLEYVPYREDHLHVSSSRLADFILRIPPLLAISFRSLTFGERMKGSYERWLYDPILRSREEEFHKYITELNRVSMKKEENVDNLNDYYELHVSNVFTFWGDENLVNKAVTLNDEIGKIEYSKRLYPFEKEKWFMWKDLRNEIEHRGRTEATLEDVLHGLAFLIILLEQLYGWRDAFFELSSDIFEIGITLET